jgi:aminopeptidase N
MALARDAELYDPNTSANINSFVTTHIHMDWKIDFVHSKIHGHVVLTLKKSSQSENILKLDCSHLKVDKVLNGVDGKELKYGFNPNVSPFGGGLEIYELDKDMPINEDGNLVIKHKLLYPLHLSNCSLEYFMRPRKRERLSNGSSQRKLLVKNILTCSARLRYAP